MRRVFLNKCVVGLAACAGLMLSAAPALAKKPELTVKIANVMASSHDTSKAVDKFAELVGQKSDGRIKVVHFPGGQLGSDKETYEAAQMGMLDIASGSSANLVTITKAFEVLHLPYLFNNLDEVHQAFDSPKVRDHINAELAKVGLHWLFTFDYGFRGINTANRRVLEPKDVAGLKLRASRSPLEVDGIKAFGASAVTVDWPEVYNALKFKVVDGEAQPFATLISGKHEEIIRETLVNDWQYYGFVGLISQKQWESYPDWALPILQEAAREAEAYHRQIWLEEDQKAREAFVASGGTITTLTAEQKQPWVELGKSIWQSSGVSDETISVVQEAFAK